MRGSAIVITLSRKASGIAVLVWCIALQQQVYAAASDEADLSLQIESILNLPDTASFVTLQEGAAYLDALCEDDDPVVAKVCDKYGDRIATYGKRLSRVQELRAEKARKGGTSVTAGSRAAPSDATGPRGSSRDAKKKVVPDPDCKRVLNASSSRNSCTSVDSDFRFGWHGQDLNETVDMEVCLIGGYEPFDFRLVDPRTGSTTLLSLQAINGIAVATTRSGECVDSVKVLFTPAAAQSIGNPLYASVAVRVQGTYQGLYPQRLFSNGMERTWLLIYAKHVQRAARPASPQ